MKNIKYKPPKKNIISSIFKSKSGMKGILKLAETKNVEHFLFYTHVNNVLIILENGIRLLDDKKLLPSQEYIVWTYLENEKSIGLEMDNSSRVNFWKWSNDANIDINEIATIAINYKYLAEISKKDWAHDDTSNLIYIYENINPEAIEWVMVKKRSEIELIKTYIENNNLNIDVFYGEKGNIEKIDKKDR
ncbi:acetyltransferase [Spiroplasma endosymbiont of Aspidapion aeneum]|uniref:acetyltransferase n=1 Tax=Spiroplasma endosymbiont of Aspidapion aeneum TaxID=3066276 RepID=UPI00313B0F0B